MSDKLKYKINELLSDLPRAMTIGRIEGILKKDHDISRDTFYRDRTILLSEEFSIPSDRLDIYAALFNTTTDKLKNYEVKKIKPLIERKPSTTMRQIMKRTNLKRK